MKVASVGAVVRAYRKASGISQKELAQLVGISRATLNYLESGRDIEIGAGKLLALLDVLAVPFAMPVDVDRAADEATVDRAARSASGKGKKLTRKVMIEAVATGRVPIGFEKQVPAFVEEATGAEVLALVRLTAAVAGMPVSTVWRNAKGLAKAVGVSRSAWVRGDS
jgi:transcriptional regulator with XRE-family HTH domain